MSNTNNEFISQFGESLVNPFNETVSPSDALSGKEYIMLYFSAHWCPPCRRFTPVLIEIYKKLKAKSTNFELVFCSLDNKEEEYKEYTSTMPWFCMPFESGESKKLATKYEADGIPHLVVVEASSGEVVTKEGTDEVSNDNDGEKFPWKPKSLKEIWPEQILASNESNDSMLNVSSLKDKYLMLYFSAHWCPPCKAFTPVLSKAYKELKAQRNDFELVFISSDRDEESFKDYFKEMSFCALPFEHRDVKNTLSKRYGIRGIPSLLMLGPVSNDETGARELINKSLNGVIRSGDFSEFPFYPKNYGSINEAENLNETKSIVLFHENGDDEEQADFEKVAKEVAAKLKDNEKTKDMQILWVFTTDGLAPRLRSLLKMPATPTDPTMAILDIPDNGGYYTSDSKDITVETIMQFVESPGDRLQLS